MILSYARIDKITPTSDWLARATFRTHLDGLAGRKVVYLDEYDPADPDHVVIAFYGGYDVTLFNTAQMLRKQGHKFEVFVIPAMIGEWSYHDRLVHPMSRFAEMHMLKFAARSGGRIQLTVPTTLPGQTPPEGGAIAASLAALDALPALAQQFAPPHLRWVHHADQPPTVPGDATIAQRLNGAIAGIDGAADNRFALPCVNGHDPAAVAAAFAAHPDAQTL